MNVKKKSIPAFIVGLIGGIIGIIGSLIILIKASLADAILSGATSFTAVAVLLYLFPSIAAIVAAALCFKRAPVGGIIFSVVTGTTILGLILSGFSIMITLALLLYIVALILAFLAKPLATENLTVSGSEQAVQIISENANEEKGKEEINAGAVKEISAAQNISNNAPYTERVSLPSSDIDENKNEKDSKTNKLCSKLFIASASLSFAAVIFWSIAQIMGFFRFNNGMGGSFYIIINSFFFVVPIFALAAGCVAIAGCVKKKNTFTVIGVLAAFALFLLLSVDAFKGLLNF